MGDRLFLGRLVLAASMVAVFSGVAAAQTGRVGGLVKDEAGNPIKGATVTAENPSASPSSFTATTDDKGRFSVIGLRGGLWTFSAQAPGFAAETGKMNVGTIGTPNPPLTFTLKKGGGAGGAMAGSGLAAKDLQADLALADADYNSGKFDEAITRYRAIMLKAPALSVINLQIAAAYRNKAAAYRNSKEYDNALAADSDLLKKEYDNALAAYNDLLKTDPNNEKAKIGVGMTNLEKGDLKAAEETLTKAAEMASASREVFYNLGEVKFAKGEADEAAKWYQRAADSDKTWGKPVFKLGLVSLNKGDKDGTIKMMEKVIEIDPTSPEAAQAKALIEQLKK